jgi:hypothetical protein
MLEDACYPALAGASIVTLLVSVIDCVAQEDDDSGDGTDSAFDSEGPLHNGGQYLNPGRFEDQQVSNAR